MFFGESLHRFVSLLKIFSFFCNKDVYNESDQIIVAVENKDNYEDLQHSAYTIFTNK